MAIPKTKMKVQGKMLECHSDAIESLRRVCKKLDIPMAKGFETMIFETDSLSQLGQVVKKKK